MFDILAFEGSFADAGWHTIIHYKSSAEPAEALAATLPSAEIVACDLNDGARAEAMIEELAKRVPDWRCLVNSASVFDYDTATRLDPETAAYAMQVNAVSPARMAQAYLRSATSSSTRCVVQITDMKLANPNPDFFSYTMSKHALAATIAMLAKHYADDANARIYGLAPGAILASHDQTEDETQVSHLLNLLGRKTGQAEIVDAVQTLASGALKSGSTLYIDSGQHLMDQPRDVIYLARAMAEQNA